MKARFVAIAVAATLGLGSVSAFAQDHHGWGRAQGQGWQHQRAEQGRGNWGRGDWGHDRYVAPRYERPQYSYRRDDGDLAGALVLGALTGALVGQAANAYSAPPVTYYSPPPATYYAPPATYYTPPATYYGPGYGYYGN